MTWLRDNNTVCGSRSQNIEQPCDVCGNIGSLSVSQENVEGYSIKLNVYHCTACEFSYYAEPENIHIVPRGTRKKNKNEIPEEVLHLARFMCQTWEHIDDWVYSTYRRDIGEYPILQGIQNRTNIKKIGQQGYDEKKIQKAIKWMLEN